MLNRQNPTITAVDEAIHRIRNHGDFGTVATNPRIAEI